MRCGGAEVWRCEVVEVWRCRAGSVRRANKLSLTLQSVAPLVLEVEGWVERLGVDGLVWDVSSVMTHYPLACTPTTPRQTRKGPNKGMVT